MYQGSAPPIHCWINGLDFIERGSARMVPNKIMNLVFPDGSQMFFMSLPLSLVDLENAQFSKKTHRQLFLDKLDQLVP